MAVRKTVKPGHIVESNAVLGEVDKPEFGGLQEPASPYSPDRAPLAKEGPVKTLRKASGATGTLTPVVLKKGASFWFKGYVFQRGEPHMVEADEAERLVRSGYFEKG